MIVIGKGINYTKQCKTALKKGICILGEHGKKVASNKVTQLHLCGCFNPIDVSTLTKEEYNCVLESLIFLTEKRDGSTNCLEQPFGEH